MASSVFVATKTLAKGHLWNPNNENILKVMEGKEHDKYKKIGRPKMDDSQKRNHIFRVRLTQREKELLEQKSKSQNMSSSDYIREQIFKTHSSSTPSLSKLIATGAALKHKIETDFHFEVAELKPFAEAINEIISASDR